MVKQASEELKLLGKLIEQSKEKDLYFMEAESPPDSDSDEDEDKNSPIINAFDAVVGDCSIKK